MLYWTPAWVLPVFVAGCLAAMIDNRAAFLAGRGQALHDSNPVRRSLGVIVLPFEAAILLHGLGALRWWLVVLVLAGTGVAALLLLRGRMAQAAARLGRPALVAVVVACALALWLGYVPDI
ncbi:hypothetical protein [Zavarzinia sp. CC-PAN008]|uniref:hypothetical protein n=1 Tax=Zavarzinia sp. CC-PAN008 TaxID=3243332 RepID=UPI003F748CDC